MRFRPVIGAFTVALCLVTVLGAARAAPVFTEDQYQQLISFVLSRFWGNAKLQDGSIVQPESDEDRRTLPIPYSEATRVVDISVPAGLAIWCGLDHLPYYSLFMRVERQRRTWSDKQIAFIGFLFGVTQGVVEGRYRNQRCDEATRSRVVQILRTAMESLQRQLRS